MRRCPPVRTGWRPRQAVFQAGEGEAGTHRPVQIGAHFQPVQDAGGEGIACADPVDDPGNRDLLGLVRGFAVSIRAETRWRSASSVWRAVEAIRLRPGRRRRPPRPLLADVLGRRHGRFRRVAAKCRGDYRTGYRRARPASGEHGARIAVPAFPQFRSIIAVERYRNAHCLSGFGGSDACGGRRAQCGRDAGQMQATGAVEQRRPVIGDRRAPLQLEWARS